MREIVAYGLIGLALIVFVTWLSFAWVRRRRRELRLRGIKTFGH